MAEITSVTLWVLFKNASSWLTNLKRASEARKVESRAAVRKIITASRETAVYIRRFNELGRSFHKTEARLSVLWTELGFELQNLGIEKLAKRCRIKGKYWSNPYHYEDEFIEKADISLDRMEQLAREILADIGR